MLKDLAQSASKSSHNQLLLVIGPLYPRPKGLNKTKYNRRRKAAANVDRLEVKYVRMAGKDENDILYPHRPDLAFVVGFQRSRDAGSSNDYPTR